MKRVVIFAAAVAAASGAGCANARYVQKAGDEGIVSVRANSDAWPEYNRTNALKLIEQHVGRDYEIVDEKEVVTGHNTVNQQNTNREATFNSQVPFLPAEKQTTTTTTTAVPVTEWQIHYRRRAASGLTGLPAVVPASGVVPTSHTVPPATVSPAGLTNSPLPPPDLSRAASN